ncbi:putative C-S lyase [Pseudooceanicola sp. 216_PA32_1]|uniref:cysteine-S-conjugate beta-lyase n=1 Tax=Pseudooceanicola pacificus TaxID=2676438 RepID=A0A844W695_9RHOB|nr:MalY/PatB family protein [Pseudooceanicola pacificus]MWB79397.1 putative C-S lyase [Pseudooceanicola pacificus]
MNFDEIIERRGTHSAKWDNMETYSGVSPDGGIPMWVADMDFRPPQKVLDAMRAYVDHGVFGYFGGDQDYLESIRWWAETRHGWQIQPEWIFSTHGLVNGAALCLHSWTQPGDGIILFTPVYHAFHRVIAAAGREVVQFQLTESDGRYAMDFDAYEKQLTGREKMVLLCSPHNPGGRCWTAEELRQLGAFCEKHDLMIVSDEIHCDLVMPGHKHLPFAVAAPELAHRTVMMTAATKTFNLAGGHTGNVIIADPKLRATFEATMAGLGLSPNAFGKHLTTAAYSPEGADWVDALCAYLDGNRRIFDEGIAEIPGLRSMPLEATYLAWVDFSGTGMDRDEIMRRVAEEAKIAVNQGPAFGQGGDMFNRFNFATPRVHVVEAVKRLKTAFADLQ